MHEVLVDVVVLGLKLVLEVVVVVVVVCELCVV